MRVACEMAVMFTFMDVDCAFLELSLLCIFMISVLCAAGAAACPA